MRSGDFAAQRHLTAFAGLVGACWWPVRLLWPADSAIIPPASAPENTLIQTTRGLHRGMEMKFEYSSDPNSKPIWTI
jgi:hypothetical protein